MYIYIYIHVYILYIGDLNGIRRVDRVEDDGMMEGWNVRRSSPMKDQSTYTYIHAYIYVCLYIQIYISMYIYMFIYIYIYV
jgi:hypothetical protein